MRNALAAVVLLTLFACDHSVTHSNRPPVASIAVEPLGIIYLGHSFSAAGSTDPDGDPLSYRWEIAGEGVLSGQSVDHLFTRSGVYAVTLTVADPVGLEDTETVNVQVELDRTADHSAALILMQGRLPAAEIQRAKDLLHIGYGHTSHGSQLTTGMAGLVQFANAGHLGPYPADLFTWNQTGAAGALHLFEGSGTAAGQLEGDIGLHDPGHEDHWAAETREYLDDPANASCNVIVWAWCWHLAWMTALELQEHYLTPMTELEAEYPGVAFVYMTAHLEPFSPDDQKAATVNARNEEIRAHCAGADRWLYDFAAIESRDPDGVSFLGAGASDECYYDSDGDGTTEHGGYVDGDGDGVPETYSGGDRNWAIDWQNNHAGGEEWFGVPAGHTQPINLNMKAYAAWWLFAQIAASLK